MLFGGVAMIRAVIIEALGLAVIVALALAVYLAG